MITNFGNSIIIKYLLGQTPSYASHIAVGIGAQPVEKISFSVTNKEIVSETVLGQTTYYAILTIDSDHTFKSGEFVTVGNVDQRVNGVFQIFSVTSTTIKYIVIQEDVMESEEVFPTGLAVRNYSDKRSLDFEVFRIPITSRGYVKEGGVSKIVFTANIPSPERYEITELGVYSAATNPSAPSSDSANIYSFIEQEGWEYHDEAAAVQIPTVFNKLDIDPGNPGVIYTGTEFGSEIITTGAKCFIADASNSTLGTEVRLIRQERSRNLGPSIFLKSDSSDIIKTAIIVSITHTPSTATYFTEKPHGLLAGDRVTISGVDPSGYNGTFVVTSVNTLTKSFTVQNTTNSDVGSAPSGGYGVVVLPRFSVASGAHIHKTFDTLLTLDSNSPTDVLKLAFSLVSVDQSDEGTTGSDQIGAVRLTLRFATSHQNDSDTNSFAQMDIEIPASSVDFSTNRYFVSTKELQEISRYGNFSWAETRVVLVYASVVGPLGNVLDKYYVALDGLRLENISSINPIYGLVAYSVIENQQQGTGGTFAQPIVKLPNVSNFIEFRYSADVI
jgi:hypothetical protein